MASSTECGIPQSVELRPYQNELVNRARRSFQSGHRAPLLVAPCGAGKTVMFSWFTKAVMARGKRILIIAHRDELIDQISETLAKFQVPHSFCAAGRPFDPRSPVVVGSIQTAIRRLDLLVTPDLIILDEAHHCVSKSWGKLTERFAAVRRIGVTATPCRLSGEPLNQVFDDLILGPSVSELINSKALCRYRLFVPDTIDVSGIPTRNGDYARGALAIAAGEPRITGNAIREYEQKTPGKRAIVFCTSIEHAKAVAAEFRAAGHVAAHLEGAMDRTVRRLIVKDFREGRIKVMTSIDVVSEGFDLPAIETAILLRPTKSLALHIQQTGRALRPYPGKECAVILDLAGNTIEHGLPDEEHLWSLDGRIKSISEKEPGVRICPNCFAGNRAGARECVDCGELFPIKSRKIVEVDGSLVEADTESIRGRRKRLKEQSKAKTLDDLIQLGRARGYKHPEKWAAYLMAARENKANARNQTVRDTATSRVDSTRHRAGSEVI